MRSTPRVDAPAALRAFPLNLAPLLSPYKKHGRLSIRIERLPLLARLSAGRNNGDNSWSLAPDELEDLTYLLPEGTNGAHTLAVRIIGLDGGGSTLGVLDLPVSPDTAVSVSVTEEAEEGAGRASRKADPENKFATLAADLLLRKDEAGSTSAAPQAEFSKAGPDEELAAQILARKGEAKPSVVAPTQAAALGDDMPLRDQSDIEIRRLRDECATLRAKLAARETALTQAGEATQQTLQRIRRDTEEALSAAEKVWKAGESARLAAAELQWKDKLKRTLAETQAARDQVEGELLRLRDECEKLQTTIADRETALAQAQLASERKIEGVQRQAHEAVLQAEKVWKAGEAARFSAAETQWHEKTKQVLEHASAKVESARGQTDGELRSLRDECAKLQKAVADHEAALVQVQLAADRKIEGVQRQAQEAVSQAEKVWKAGEAARLSAAEAQWHEMTKKALGDASAKVEGARNQADGELRSLRDECAKLQKAVADHEAALTQAHSEADRKIEGLQRQVQEAVSQAEKVWKAGEAARFSAAEMQWQEKTRKVLEDASAKVEGARGQTDGELRRLRDECAKLQTAVADRESALAQAGKVAQQTIQRMQRETEETLSQAENLWKADEAARLAAAEARWQKESAAKLAELTARCERAEAAATKPKVSAKAQDQGDETELRRLRAAFAALDASLRDREAALAQMRMEAEQGREQWQQESAAALSQAQLAWQADEASRFAAAEAQWQEQLAQQLAEVMARQERAGDLLGEAAAKASAAEAREQSISIELRNLRAEAAALHAAVAERDAELARVSSAVQGDSQTESATAIILRPNRIGGGTGDFERKEEPEEERPSRRRLMRDAFVAASLAAAAIVFFPGIQNWIPGTQTTLRASAPVAAPPPASPATPKQRMALVDHGANVRSGPSPTAEVVFTVTRGMRVELFEQQGNWTRIRLDAEGDKSKPREGWMYTPYLKVDERNGQQISSAEQK